MARILLSAYACEPGRGSEPGVGWGWATELAHLGHSVTVLTRTANQHAIQRAERQPGHLRFVYYELPSAIQHLRRFPGGRAIYYVLWQWFCVRRIRQLFPALPFDLVHHVTYVSARYPSFMGALRIPFWFGPVSGGEVIPPTLRAGFSAGQRRRERLRNLSNLLVRWDPLMNRTFRQAERIFVTRDTVSLVPRRWRHKVAVRLAIGLSDLRPAIGDLAPPDNTQPFHLLYVGRLLEWKGVHIALRAVALLRRSRPDVHFTIVGAGPAKTNLLRLVNDLHLESAVQWMGYRPHAEVQQHYRQADLLLFPSLRDSGGMVVLEALSHGLPVLCTDLGGPGVIVNASCGAAVATGGRTTEQIAHDLARAALKIATTPQLLLSLRYGARARAREFQFHNLVQSIHNRPAAEMARPA